MKEKPNEDVIVLCKCTTNHKTFGMRSEKVGYNHWNVNWAFPIKEAAAAREGYDKSSIGGSIEYDADYPGCPYCGSVVFARGGQCGRLTCNNFAFGTATCEWCGAQGQIGAYNGEKITAGMDA